MARSRCDFGCCFLRWSATLEDPISANTLTLPDASIRGTTTAPGAWTVLITPLGNAVRNASISGVNSSVPYCGGLNATVLPMSSAGISVANVSLSG